MSISIALARAAQAHGHRIAIRRPEGDQTWAQTVDRISRAAGGLYDLGLKKGEALAILAGNCPEVLEITYAAIWAGIVIVPLNTRLSTPEINDILHRSGAKALAFDRAHEGRLSDVSVPLMAHIAIEGEAWEGFLQTSPPAPRHEARPEEILGIYYTGGTTGTPKGVELSQNAFHITSLDIQIEVKFTEDDVYLHSAPFFHLADSGLGHAATYAGAAHAFLPVPTAEATLKALQTFGVTTMMSVPTGFHDLVDLIPQGEQLPKVRGVVYGAAPMPVPLLRRMMQVFPNARFVQFYGQTELCGCCTALRPEDHRLDGTKLGTVGRATASSLIRIADAEGRALPPGQSGEIQVKGYYQMSSYKDDPARTAETFVDGWLRTGDVGSMDEDGYLTVSDRIKDMVVSGGENVFCGEVEAALASHPSIAQVAVIGRPDPRWGEAVHAVLVLKPQARLDQEDIFRHCRAQIAAYKCPKSISVATSLPLSAVGKVRKDQLRRDLEAAPQLEGQSQ